MATRVWVVLLFSLFTAATPPEVFASKGRRTVVLPEARRAEGWQTVRARVRSRMRNLEIALPHNVVEVTSRAWFRKQTFRIGRVGNEATVEGFGLPVELRLEKLQDTAVLTLLERAKLAPWFADARLAMQHFLRNSHIAQLDLSGAHEEGDDGELQLSLGDFTIRSNKYEWTGLKDTLAEEDLDEAGLAAQEAESSRHFHAPGGRYELMLWRDIHAGEAWVSPWGVEFANESAGDSRATEQRVADFRAQLI